MVLGGVDDAAMLVANGVGRRQAAVALGVDRVVETPIGNRVDGDTGRPLLTVRQVVERLVTAVTPTPHRDALAIDKRLFGQPINRVLEVC